MRNSGLSGPQKSLGNILVKLPGSWFFVSRSREVILNLIQRTYVTPDSILIKTKRAFINANSLSSEISINIYLT